MIWLAWRLQRSEAALVAATLVLVGAVLVPLGLHMASVYSDTHVGGCLAHGGVGCGGIVDSFRQRFEHVGSIVPWLNFLPGLIGVLFAAPLVLDFEHGTFRFSWTQSVPRSRWLASRLALMIAAALLATFVLTELMTWFRGPIDQVTGRMEPNVFDFEGIVPYAYTLFALALVLALGVITRRAIVAGGLSLITYFGVRIGLQTWGRKNYAAPLRKVWPPGQAGPRALDHAWNIISGPSDHAGHLIPQSVAERVLLKCGGAKTGNVSCMRAHGIYNLAIYQPANRFWLLQGIEAAIFSGLAVVLFGVAIWWVRHRVS